MHKKNIAIRKGEDWIDNEIPQGKRTIKYRFFEILPGALSYAVILLLPILSLISPVLGSIYLLIIITTTLVKAIGVAYRTVQGYRTVKKAEKVDWHQRFLDLNNPHESYERLCEKRKLDFQEYIHLANLKRLSCVENLYDDKTSKNNKGKKNNECQLEKNETIFPKPSEIYHAILVMAYNEGIETLEPSIRAIKDSTFSSEKIIVILGYEERGGAEMELTAKKLNKIFKDDFFDFVIVKHPDSLPNEIKGKGPNLCFAGEALKKIVKKKKIDPDHVIVTSLDSDNRMSEYYLDYVAYEFVTRPNRQRLSYQPVSLFMNNIWETTAPMRVIAISNSFFNIISTMKPHTLKNFASHSQPLSALIDMNFWSKRTIVEDGHQYWRSLFHFKGDYEVVPIHVPIYQDAVIDETLVKTLSAQFVQLRRWDYGASDVAYVGVRLFSKDRKRQLGMSFLPLFVKFWRLLDGHVMLAAMSPIVAFGGWVPRMIYYNSRDLLTYNLPNTVSVVQLFASIGLMATILVSLHMIPKRPEGLKTPRVVMILQWCLMPIIAIVYTSAAAFYSQTRLMLGRYMEKFDVTKKMVR